LYWGSYIVIVMVNYDCNGAIDGTHVRAFVPKEMEVVFCGRKSHPTQNVMSVVDFDLWFIFVIVG
jgi:hypothetical protein